MDGVRLQLNAAIPAQTARWVCMEFRVIWEINVHADNPLQAAEQARCLQLNPEMPATIFGVWDYHKVKMHRVDLNEPIDRLDNAALGPVRANLRRMQCANGLDTGIKDLAAVMLIFLDEAGRPRRR